MGTLRHTRYQAAILQGREILLLQCAFRDGPTVWILPGGGREEGESEAECVAREVLEETALTVRVDRLLYDCAAEPSDGTYVRWQTYRCSVIGGIATPGGGEGASAELVDLQWLPLDDEARWPEGIRTDPYLAPQLHRLREERGDPCDPPSAVRGHA